MSKMSVNGNGGIYAPLKQVFSDSDSDDDKRQIPFEVASDLDVHSKNYSMSELDDGNTNLNTVETTTDNVSFLQSDMSNKLSFARRCAFIASILFCVFTVVIFLWGLPCADFGNCATEWQDKTTSWELPYEEIELSGSIQVVNGALPHSKNLIFIYRGNHMRSDKSNDNVNGVLLIVGSSGKVGWYTRESRIPTDINCSLLDLNKDGQLDCIISGSEGLLATLNPLSGTYYWSIHKHGKELGDIVSIDFPVVVNDINKDGIKDLLSVATISPSSNHNNLVMFSGATGTYLYDPWPINECLSIKILPELNSDSITYLCKNGTLKSVRIVSYDIWSKRSKTDSFGGKSASVLTVTKRVNLTANKKNYANARHVFNNGPGKLIVENYGQCPNSCKVNLKLLLEKNGTTYVNWEYSANHVYAMNPSSFAFANSVKGFVIKL